MKKVLIISYYWPPAGGSGVQRWLKFSKYLPNHNFSPIIFTPENPYFEVLDQELLSEVSPLVEVCKLPIWEPYRLKDILFGKGIKAQSAGVIPDKTLFKNKLLNWLRGNIFIPDPKVYWIKPSIKRLIKKIQEEDIKYIITTGPPHSMHLIGLGLKKRLPSLKWIADFRDPWSGLDILNEFYLSSIARKKHKKLEKKVLESADITLTVSPTWVDNFKSLGSQRVELITNGYDIDDFSVKKKSNNKFIIGHYGLLNHLRNPKNLWKTLDNICSEDIEFDKKLEIHFAGNTDQEVITDIMSFSYLKNKVKHLGYLSHAEVINQYNEASVLLLLLFESKSGIGNYPGKIFEYFAAKKPILAFGPDNSDTQQLIKDTESGFYHTYSDITLRNTIIKLFNESSLIKNKNIAQFSRKELTKKLANLIHTL